MPALSEDAIAKIQAFAATPAGVKLLKQGMSGTSDVVSQKMAQASGDTIENCGTQEGQVGRHGCPIDKALGGRHSIQSICDQRRLAPRAAQTPAPAAGFDPENQGQVHHIRSQHQRHGHESQHHGRAEQISSQRKPAGEHESEVSTHNVPRTSSGNPASQQSGREAARSYQCRHQRQQDAEHHRVVAPERTLHLREQLGPRPAAPQPERATAPRGLPRHCRGTVLKIVRRTARCRDWTAARVAMTMGSARRRPATRGCACPGSGRFPAPGVVPDERRRLRPQVAGSRSTAATTGTPRQTPSRSRPAG